MSKAKEKLLIDIDRFLAEFDMAASTFGRLAVNDGKFVKRLKSGARYWPETEEKVRAYMARRRKEAGK